MLSLIAAAALAVALPPLGPSHLVDQAGIIPPDDQTDIAMRIQRVQARDKVDLAVLTLSAIDEAPAVVAQRAYVSWNLSQRGVLILISMSPKKIHVQPGPGLNGMPTSNWDQVFQVMRYHAAAGNFSEAIRQGLNVAVARLHIYDQSVAAASAVPRSVQPQLPPALTVPPPPLPLPPRAAATQPVSPAVQIQPVADEPGWVSAHPFRFTLMLVLMTVGTAILVRRAWRRWQQRRMVAYDIETDPELTPVPPYRERSHWDSAPQAYRDRYVVPVAVPQPSQVVVQQSVSGGGGGGSGSGDFAAGMVMNELLHQHQQPPPPARSCPTVTPTYQPPLPPPPAPAPSYTPPSFNNGGSGDFGSSDFSSGSGGSFDNDNSPDFSSGSGGDFGGGGGFSSGGGGDF